MTHWGTVTAMDNVVGAQGSTPLELEVDDLPARSNIERNLAEGIRGLYQKCQMYDLNLVVGQQRIPAHKAVLAAMSRTCCEKIQEAVAQFQAQREGTVAAPAAAEAAPAPAPAPAPAEEKTVTPEEASATGIEAAEERKAVPFGSRPAVKESNAEPEVVPEKHVAEVAVAVATPPVYNNQWKSEAPAPAPAEAPAAEVENAQGTAPAPPSAPAATVEVATAAAPAPAAPAAAPAAAPMRPELHLDFISKPEAARALLDLVYGLGEDYNITTDEANHDVLRLAKRLDLPCLEELATRWLAQGLTTENVIHRLATCKEFGLEVMYDTLEEELVTNRPALLSVSEDLEVTTHPEILQGLLVRSARTHRPIPGNEEVKSNKRSLDEPRQGREKMAKVSQGRALAGLAGGA